MAALLALLSGIHDSTSVSRDGSHVGIAVADEPPSGYASRHIRAHTARVDDPGDAAQDEIFTVGFKSLFKRPPEYGFARGFGNSSLSV